jgi:hypothetical protein
LGILGAGGESLDKCYLQQRRVTECWSIIKFAEEVVTEEEMSLWCMAAAQVVADGLAGTSLGPFCEEGHKMVVEDPGEH